MWCYNRTYHKFNIYSSIDNSLMYGGGIKCNKSLSVSLILKAVKFGFKKKNLLFQSYNLPGGSVKTVHDYCSFLCWLRRYVGVKSLWGRVL